MMLNNVAACSHHLKVDQMEKEYFQILQWSRTQELNKGCSLIITSPLFRLFHCKWIIALFFPSLTPTLETDVSLKNDRFCAFSKKWFITVHMCKRSVSHRKYLFRSAVFILPFPKTPCPSIHFLPNRGRTTKPKHLNTEVLIEDVAQIGLILD